MRRRIPVQTRTEAISSASGSGEVSPDSPLVLVVDDYEDTRELLAFALRRKGLRVVCAVDGFSALDIAERCPPQAIVMDIAMPGLDGIETTRRMRKQPALESVPIVALSGHALPRYIEGAKAAGCDSFLAKPCPVDEVAHELRRLLAIQAARSTH